MEHMTSVPNNVPLPHAVRTYDLATSYYLYLCEKDFDFFPYVNKRRMTVEEVGEDGLRKIIITSLLFRCLGRTLPFKQFLEWLQQEHGSSGDRLIDYEDLDHFLNYVQSTADPDIRAAAGKARRKVTEMIDWISGQFHGSLPEEITERVAGFVKLIREIKDQIPDMVKAMYEKLGSGQDVRRVEFITMLYDLMSPYVEIKKQREKLEFVMSHVWSDVEEWVATGCLDEEELHPVAFAAGGRDGADVIPDDIKPEHVAKYFYGADGAVSDEMEKEMSSDASSDSDEQDKRSRTRSGSKRRNGDEVAPRRDVPHGRTTRSQGRNVPKGRTTGSRTKNTPSNEIPEYDDATGRKCLFDYSAINVRHNLALRKRTHRIQVKTWIFFHENGNGDDKELDKELLSMMGLFRCKEKGHVNEGYICVKYNWRRWMLWDVEHWHCKLYLALHRTIGTRCYSVPHPSRNDCHPSKEAGMIPPAMETIHKESKKSFMDHHDRLLEVKHPFLSIFDDNVVSATPSESGDQQPAAQDGDQQTSAVEQQLNV
jgi:hypothetical protein